MGILDDAIREHLELKRSLGADDDELKQLEDEAFGPPARPGDPDFPESEPEPAAEAAPPDAGEPVATVQEPTAEAGAGPEEGDPSAPGLFDQAAGAPATAEAEAAPPAPPEAPETPLPRVRPPSDAEPAAAEGGDADQGDELDLGELDLEIEEAELPPLDPSPPIESLETVEHKLEPGTGEEREVGEEEEDEDVLADTPEFLRDAPEDDDLWFEQGEPKDFDFDE